VELADRSARTGRRSTRDLERTTEPIRHPVLDFLSLFKGQGAAVRGDDVSSTAGTATTRGGRL